MSERLAVCEALAAMIRQHGDPNEEEVTFIGMAAMQLGLDQNENEQVQKTLRDGGEFSQLIERITSKPMRAFFVRRMLSAALLDEQINDAEQDFIDQTATVFGIDRQVIADLVAWMRVGIEVERRLGQLLVRI